MKEFIQELRTQYIYRIAAGYLVSVWLILQIAALLCSALSLPSWTLKALLALLLAGFGAALIVGWKIDLRVAQLAVATKRARTKRVHLVLWPAAVIFIAAGAILAIYAFLDANQLSRFAGGELQTLAPAESATPVPEIVLTDGTRVSLGDQQVLLNDQDLGLRAMPTAGIAMIENRPGRVRLLIGASSKTYLLEGSDLKHLNALPRLVLEPGLPGSFDNAAADAFAVVHSGSVYYAFYQASDNEGLPPATFTGYAGFYLSIGLAESDDDGNTWVKRGQILKCAKPKEWAVNPVQGARGIGQPGGLADASGKNFYIFYTDWSTPQGSNAGQIKVARCSLADGPPLPGNWKKYYNGAFNEPGIGGEDTPVIDVYSAGHSGAWYGRPTYAKFMGKYVIVFAVTRAQEWQNGSPAQTSGIYLAMSDDLVKWSEQFKLLSGYTQRVLGRRVLLAPTLVFDPDDKTSGWLTYGYTPKYSTEQLSNVGTPVYLVARRFKFDSAQR